MNLWSGEVIPDEYIPFQGEETLEPGELLVIAGQETWDVETGGRRYVVRATGGNKRDRVQEQVESI
jgi:hypothetical protein